MLWIRASLPAWQPVPPPKTTNTPDGVGRRNTLVSSSPAHGSAMTETVSDQTVEAWLSLLTDRKDMGLVLYSKHTLSFQMHWESLGSNICTRAATTSPLCWWGNQTMGQESKLQMGRAWWFERTPEGEGQFARQGNLRPCLLLLVYLSWCSLFLGAPSRVTSAGKPCASGSEQSSNAFKDLWLLMFRIHGQKNWKKTQKTNHLELLGIRYFFSSHL